ncbi:twitching motility protein PilT [Pelagicoccus sp. SDUM812002]|uniref:twitching motility protein PilT n=1 Tax=Pelagicoccus sp. SDUM812002 TaxID=3041266 RepID=UPI0028108B57|nr:twitching motility protein PilT [Pelagicoccus sp. SDUM812002]MDQ8186889.1 twitching motility protein PilT [Pelagicoccus sp. SDUM812002]
MNQSILTFRAILLAFCALGGYGVWYAFNELGSVWLVMTVAVLIGCLLILVDMLMKGFSLRGLSALTFGLLAGILAAHLITISPLFEEGDAQVIYISRVGVFVAVTYLGAIIALRGKDEFNLVIPYVRFDQQQVEVPLAVLDETTLVDGRVSKLVAARMLVDVLFVPKFVVDELNELSNSSAEEERNRGKRGLKTLAELRSFEHVEVRLHESELKHGQSREEKMLFIVRSLKGRLLSVSDSLSSRAKQEGVPFVDMLGLAKALSQEVTVGQAITVRLVKTGREDSQGVGYLEDGSMVVVNGAADLVGADVLIEVDSIIPTSGGRMVFGKMLGQGS